MSMNETPSAGRIHIGFFGRRNAGKSSLVNAVTGQKLSVVSDVLGTTTDPVSKAMELLPLGPVVVIDTPGFDDEGDLGSKRVLAAKRILEKVDIAVIVMTIEQGISDYEIELVNMCRDRNISFVIALNKSDLNQELPVEIQEFAGDNLVKVSALTGENIYELKEKIGKTQVENEERYLLFDLINPGDVVVMVIPIDKAAPKGRLILPQQQTIRDVLDRGAISITCRDAELSEVLQKFGDKVKLVVTDSQAFGKVNKLVPKEIYLTSFSILMARFKGSLDLALKGARAIDEIENGDKIVISEGCTHHRQCGDIGTEKLPKWIKEYTGKDVVLVHTSGNTFADDLEGVKLVIHCGGCMLNEREMAYRRKLCVEAGVPITNYGIAIAHMNGILKRSIEIIEAGK